MLGPLVLRVISVDNNDAALCSLRGGLPVWTAAVRVGGAGAAGGGGGGARGGGALVRATAVRRVGTATPAQPRPRGGRHAVRAAPVLGDRAVATLHTAEVIETTICIIRDLVEGPGGGGEVVRAAAVLRGGAAAVSGAGAVLGPRAVRAAPVLGVAAAADLGRLAGAGTGGGLVKVKGIILLQVCGTLLLLLLLNTFLANIGYDQTVLHDHHLTPITFNTTAAISLCPMKDKYNCNDNSLCLPHYLNIYMKELPSLNAKFLF